MQKELRFTILIAFEKHLDKWRKSKNNFITKDREEKGNQQYWIHATSNHACNAFYQNNLTFSRIEDSFTRVIYLLKSKDELQEGRMEKDRLISISQVTCDHAKQKRYTQTCFDILNGFEIVLTRCINCHKIIAFEAKKLN